MISISVCLSDIPKDRMFVSDKSGKAYIELIVSEKKEPDQYGKTHSVYISQQREERLAKADKMYVGSGKALGNQETAKKPETVAPTDALDDLPF